jgi:hypothetical protein
VSDDPNDATAKRDLGMSLSRLGMLDPEPNKAAESLATLREARGLIETIAKANPGSAEAEGQVAIIQEHEGHSLEDLGRVPEAIVSYWESVATGHPFLDQPSATIMSQYLTESLSMRQKTTQIHIYVGSRTTVDANSLGLARAMRVRASNCRFGWW